MDEVKDDLRDQYDREAEVYDKCYESPAGNYFMWRKIRTALYLASFQEGSHLLEVGSASGAYTFEFAKLGFRMTGLDLSPECVKYAAEKARRLRVSNVEFVLGDAEDLSMLPDNTFDGVVSFSCLRYVPNPQLAVNEIFRVVRERGEVVVDFPNKISPWFKYLKPLLTGNTHIHDHHYSTREVRAFLQRSGFQEIRMKRILYTPKFIGPTLLKGMKCADFVGELPPLNHFAAIIMCRGRKI